ncbi:hypothetical protein BDZ94DRAFT_1318108 [Collybia nuda]|uniref:Galactose oxidase n=1 Tax=Collybia nuda TaxID=64659 RepID=A0A9P5YG13_9AGAR|nr:hypothetical protein BDZ94DRAFT_1318108 [Collybia nuda]
MDARHLCVICFAILLSTCIAAYDAVPRWGQATIVINDALFVYGGKTDQFNAYSYSSAPNSNDLLYLPLTSSFEAASPPWQLVTSSSNLSASQGPAISWHTLSVLNTSEVLLFGGQPGPDSPTVLVGEADSAFLLNIYRRLEPEWIPEVASWAGQPIRRIYHSSATAISGRVFIIGGEKADGSNNGFSDHYVFDPGVPSFTPLPVNNSPPDLSGHKSIILADGRLLVFGGYSHSQNLLIPFTTIWAIDVTKQGSTWSLLNISHSPLPSPRRAFVAVHMGNGKILIHGGSDASLQNNLADGWILDTSQTPMVWSEIDTLSRLGARRDHFAISYGAQIIFGFGYDNVGPAPATLQIFNVDEDSFSSRFTPLPLTFTPTPTLPGPSQTSYPNIPGHSETEGGGSVHPTSASDPNSGDPNNGNGDNNHSKTTAIAVGTVFGVLGLLVVGLVGAYYIRRKHTGSPRHFMALRTGDGDDDENSLHVTGEIPAVVYANDKTEFGHGWSLGIIHTLGLAGVIGAATGSRNVRLVQGRRDMLADEDTRDFREWYDARRRDGTGGSSRSLRSILTTRVRGREVSTGTTREALQKEREYSLSDNIALMDGEENGYSGTATTVRPPERRQMSYASTSSGKSYVDPFADPIQEERRSEIVTDPWPYPQLAQPLSTPRITIPVSMGAHALSPLPERASQNTLYTNDPATSTSSHSDYLHSPFDTSPSQFTSRTSLELLHSPKLPTSSIVGSGLSPNQPIRRSDTWWSRFARTSFLDRRTTDVSRRSDKIPEIRDPNPPPRLGPIQESMHSISPDQKSPESRSDLTEQDNSVPRRPSNIYGTHNKSTASVRTADTEAIEKIAGTMDVVQRVRTGSHRTTGSTSTAGTSTDTSSDLWGQAPKDMKDNSAYELSMLESPVEMNHAEASTYPRTKLSPEESSSSPLHLPIVDSSQKPGAEGTIATRIRAIESKTPQDHEKRNLMDPRKWEGKARKNTSVNYGLVQRPSLYIANPDHRVTSSGNS